jgi:AbrB family transcriptional regulator (stage V sporulation protein T)
MTETGQSLGANTVWQTKLDASGRIVLPAEARLELGLDQGDEVLLVRDEHGLHVKTPAQLVREVQAYFSALWPKERSVTEELLRERREEALREAGGD